MMSLPILSLMIFLPLASALVLILMPRDRLRLFWELYRITGQNYGLPYPKISGNGIIQKKQEKWIDEHADLFKD